MMAVPERVIYREGELLRPEAGVNRVGVCRSGRHSAEVRIDVLLRLEVFPVGCSFAHSMVSPDTLLHRVRSIGD